jgi:hypothetical protein
MNPRDVMDERGSADVYDASQTFSNTRSFIPSTRMPPTEHSSLLPSNGSRSYNGVGDTQPPREHLPFPKRVRAFLVADGEPGWIASYRYFFFNSWFNVLLVFVPLSAIAHHLNWDVALRFSFSFFAIMPLAKVRASALSLEYCSDASNPCCCIMAPTSSHAYIFFLSALPSIMIITINSCLVTLLNKCPQASDRQSLVFSMPPLVTLSKSSSVLPRCSEV